MFRAIRDWPLGAKFLAWCGLAVLTFYVWSALASFVFLAGIRMLEDDTFPLMQFWRYAGYYGFGHPIAGFWLKTAATVATVIPTTLALFVVLRNGLPNAGNSLHGFSRWANARERKKGGFYAQKGGLIMGRDEGGKLIQLGGDGHIFVAAPTRSGKGVGVVIPNCMMFDGSIVVLDPKRENYDFTAGIRAAAGQKTYLFDPLSTTGQSHRYNPLDMVRRGKIDAYDDIQRIAQMIYPNVSGDQAFWNDAARQAFFGFACYLMETPGRPFTIGEIFRLLSRPSSVPMVKAEVARRRATGNPYSEACVTSLDDYLNNPEDLVNNIRKSATTKLGLWANPRIDAATSASDFDLRTLRQKLQAIYVGVDPNQIAQLRPLLSLFFQQLIDVNVQQLPRNDSSLKYKVLVLLDEFPLLGAMPVLADAVAFVAGFNLRMLFIAQSWTQLRDKDLYGPDKAATIRENCEAELVFGVKTSKAAEEVSSELGYNTVLATTRSGPSLWRAIRPNKVNASQSEQRRALLLPQEVLRLDERQSIITKAGMFPIKARRVRYYEEAPFQKLVLPRPEVPVIKVTLRMDGDDTSAPVDDETGAEFPPSGVNLTESEAVAAGAVSPDVLADEEEILVEPMMPHQANSLMASILSTEIDLTEFGLEDGKAAVARIIDRLPTSNKDTTSKKRSATA